MTTTANIREMQVGDVHRVYDLMKEKAKFDGILMEFRATPESLIELTTSKHLNTRVLVADSNDNGLVGYIVYLVMWSVYANRNFYWLDDLFVATDHRKSGIAKKLFQYMCREGVEKNIHRIDWIYRKDNDRADEFYKKQLASTYEEYSFTRLESAFMSQ